MLKSHLPPETHFLRWPIGGTDLRESVYWRAAIAAAAPTMKPAAVRFSAFSARGDFRNQRALAASAR